MATTITIIHTQDFIRASPDGLLDLETSKKSLLDIATASVPLIAYRILIDTRRAQVKMSITDLWYLATELSNLGKAFLEKTAVLCPIQDFDHAGFFALCAKNKGYPVNAFTSFEAAIEWLIV
jgi:hypothetical protein